MRTTNINAASLLNGVDLSFCLADDAEDAKCNKNCSNNAPETHAAATSHIELLYTIETTTYSLILRERCQLTDFFVYVDIAL